MTACPNCRATVRPGAPFCSLCHTDFRPRPEPAAPAAPAPAQAPTNHVVDPLTAPLLDVVLPPGAVPVQAAPIAPLPAVQAPEIAPPQAEAQWPCQTCGVSNPLSSDLCTGCGASFLAAAREQMSVVLPGVGDLMSMSRGQRLALAAGGAVLVGLLPVVLAVLGKLV